VLLQHARAYDARPVSATDTHTAQAGRQGTEILREPGEVGHSPGVADVEELAVPGVADVEELAVDTSPGVADVEELAVDTSPGVADVEELARFVYSPRPFPRAPA
jgi:hypothetical protein